MALGPAPLATQQAIMGWTSSAFSLATGESRATTLLVPLGQVSTGQLPHNPNGLPVLPGLPGLGEDFLHYQLKARGARRAPLARPLRARTRPGERTRWAGAMRPMEQPLRCGQSALAPSAHGGRPPDGNPGTGPRRLTAAMSADRACAGMAIPALQALSRPRSPSRALRTVSFPGP